MEFQTDILFVQDSIANDELIEAIGRLISIAREENISILDESLLMSRDLASLKKATTKGIINWQEQNSERRKLSSRILELLKNIA